MFGNINRGINIAKIIDTMQKSLEMINQLIPVYKDTKPMLENAKNTFKNFKKWAENNIEKIPNNKNVQEIKEKINTIKSINLNNPTFFQ